MRRGSLLATGLIAALAIGGVFYVYKTRREAEAAPVTAPAAVPVVAGVVTRHDAPVFLRGVGTVIAYNTLVVRSQIQGQITQVAFTEGQSVKAGNLLAQIEPRPYQAQLDQVIATRDRDQAQVANVGQPRALQ
jgi:multidrug efflux system membrane fusion protein